MGKKHLVPTVQQLFSPVFQALKQCGGHATTEKIEEIVAETLKLSREAREEQHYIKGKPTVTELRYHLYWVKVNFKLCNIILNGAKDSEWVLTHQYEAISTIDPKEISRIVALFSKEKKQKNTITVETEKETLTEENHSASSPNNIMGMYLTQPLVLRINDR